MSIELVIPSNHLILCRPFVLLSSIFPSIRVFSSESVLHIRWPKYWSFSFSISPSSEYSGLLSFRMDWLDLLVVQGTLKSLLQLHNSKASILQHSYFFIVQLSHAYITTGKTIALTRWTFVGKVMSLLFNMLSRLVITFLQEQASFNCMSAVTMLVILEPPKIKSVTLSIVSPSISHEMMGPDAMILVFWMLSFKPAFSLPSFTFIKGSLVPLHFLPLGWCHLHIWGYWYFYWQVYCITLLFTIWCRGETFVKLNLHIEHEIKIHLNFSMCVKILQSPILHLPLNFI